MSNKTETKAEVIEPTVGEVSKQELLKDKRANEIVAVVKSSKGGPGLELELNGITGPAFTRAEELRETMAPAVKRAGQTLGGDSNLAKQIEEAVLVSEAINPNSIKNSFLFKYVPSKAVRKWVIKQYATGIPSHEKQANAVWANLRVGKEETLREMLILSKQYENLIEVDEFLDSEIASTKTAMNQLQAVDTTGFAQREQDKYELAVNKVSRVHRDLINIKAATAQFFTSIDEIVKSNSPLIDSVDSILFVGPLVVDNAMMINSSLNKRKAVISAAQSASKMIGEGLKDNAAMVKQGALDIQKLHEDPVIGIEDFEQSFKDLQEAVQIGRETIANSTAKANEMSAALEKMTNEFKTAIDDFNTPVAVEQKAG